MKHAIKMKEKYTRLSSEKNDKEVKIGRFSASCYIEKADLYSRYEPFFLCQRNCNITKFFANLHILILA